jgi:hypothetical protein
MLLRSIVSTLTMRRRKLALNPPFGNIPDSRITFIAINKLRS